MNTAETDLIIWMWRDNDVSLIGVFGSSARGEATATSDIEIGSAKYWGNSLSSN